MLMEKTTDSSTPRAILVVEDEAVLRESLAELLVEENYHVLQAANGRIAKEMLQSHPIDVILSDIRMPEMDGIELLKLVQEKNPEIPMIMITAYGTINDAVQAMRSGASDYLVKPVQFDDVILRIQRAIHRHEMRRVNKVMTEQLSASSDFHNLIGESQSMMSLFAMVRKLSTVKSNVLIIGDSGTGKELFARAIHNNGITRDQPFVPVNCGGIPDNLVESELFGHCRGAFTGAHKDKIGYFEAANGGTLFLDEISTLPMSVQSSLLRALEDQMIIPVGDTQPRGVNVRIIAASNQDMDMMAAAGEFREDVLYRLNVVKLQLPPLRNRKEDIPLLVRHFLVKHADVMKKTVADITDGAMLALINYDWPGNIRELENAIERAVIFADNDRIQIEHLPFASGDIGDSVSSDLKEALRQFERQHILNALQQNDYEKSRVAENLGIGVSSLYRKMDELDIPKKENSNAEEDPA